MTADLYGTTTATAGTPAVAGALVIGSILLLSSLRLVFRGAVV